MCRLTRPFALAFATYCVCKGGLLRWKRALMAISFSLFCGSCGKGMSRYMAYIAQKGGIMTVLLSKGFLIFILGTVVKRIKLYNELIANAI